MQNQKPVKLYFFVTFLIILAVLLIGLNIKDYLSQKFPDEPVQQNATKPIEKTDEVSQAFALLDMAIGISLVMVLLFVIVKIIMGKLRRV